MLVLLRWIKHEILLNTFWINDDNNREVFSKQSSKEATRQDKETTIAPSWLNELMMGLGFESLQPVETLLSWQVHLFWKIMENNSFWLWSHNHSKLKSSFTITRPWGYKIVNFWFSKPNNIVPVLCTVTWDVGSKVMNSRSPLISYTSLNSLAYTKIRLSPTWNCFSSLQLL